MQVGNLIQYHPPPLLEGHPPLEELFIGMIVHVDQRNHPDKVGVLWENGVLEYVQPYEVKLIGK